MRDPERLVIEGATVVTPMTLIPEGRVVVEDGCIAAVEGISGRPSLRDRGVVPAGGALCLPGLVDLHSDAIEKEVTPRPGTYFPLDMAVGEMDRRLALAGITTMYHAVSFAEGEIGIRSNRIVADIIRCIGQVVTALMVRHRVHARFEITDLGAVPIIENLLGQGLVNLVSFMDHTPGQGQYKETAAYIDFLRRHYHLNEDELQECLTRKFAIKARGVADSLLRIAHAAKLAGVPLASHDDDTREKVREIQALGVVISEFPVSVEAAEAAKEAGMQVCMGSPNVLRGGSASGNLDAVEAIRRGIVDILCSDYHPPSLLHAPFLLDRQGVLPLAEAVRLVTLHPARAAGIEATYGSVEEGKVADLLLVEIVHGRPRVRQMLVGGRTVLHLWPTS